MSYPAIVQSLVKYLDSEHALLFRFIRFAIIGLVSGLTYVLAVAFWVEVVSLSPKLASILGYLIALPLSFAGHRKITFRSTGNPFREFIRFVVVHGANILISLAAMIIVVDYLDYSHWLGSAFAVLLVPVSTFVILQLWVFSGSNN